MLLTHHWGSASPMTRFLLRRSTPPCRGVRAKTFSCRRQCATCSSLTHRLYPSCFSISNSSSFSSAADTPPICTNDPCQQSPFASKTQGVLHITRQLGIVPPAEPRVCAHACLLSSNVNARAGRCCMSPGQESEVPPLPSKRCCTDCRPSVWQRAERWSALGDAHWILSICTLCQPAHMRVSYEGLHED